MLIYEFDKTPGDIEKRIIEKHEIDLFLNQKRFVLSQDGETLCPRFGVDIEGFKTNRDEYVFKRGELIKSEMVGGKRKDKFAYSLIILQDNGFTSLPFPEGLSLNDVDILGYHNNRICMLGKRGGKYFAFRGYNKPLISSETSRLLQ